MLYLVIHVFSLGLWILVVTILNKTEYRSNQSFLDFSGLVCFILILKPWSGLRNAQSKFHTKTNETFKLL